MPRTPGEALLRIRRQRAEKEYSYFPRQPRDHSVYDKKRPERHKFYHTSEWRKLREAHIRRYPLCEVCKEAGRITPARIVHHIVEIKDGGSPLDTDNLQSVCRSCHNRLHAGGRGA